MSRYSKVQPHRRARLNLPGTSNSHHVASRFESDPQFEPLDEAREQRYGIVHRLKEQVGNDWPALIASLGLKHEQAVMLTIIWEKTNLWVQRDEESLDDVLPRDMLGRRFNRPLSSRETALFQRFPQIFNDLDDALWTRLQTLTGKNQPTAPKKIASWPAICSFQSSDIIWPWRA